jgi:hypothetical protein
MQRDLVKTLILISAVTTALPARAQDEAADTALPRLGLAPGEPGERSVPPSTPFGIAPAQSGDYVLDFHGYMLLPLRVGVLKRANPEPGQSETAIHAPPATPQDFRSFGYTGVVPEPWVQLNFSYGNRTIAATAIIATRSVTLASGFYNPVEQLGVNDAYLSVNLSDTFKTPFEVKVGAFTGRYGAMGMYDAGRYATPLIARTNAIGEGITAGFKLSPSLTLVIEQGLGGQLGRPPRNIVPAAWNDFADDSVGSSFANHIHAGLDLGKLLQVGAHYLTAWSQDEQASRDNIPDGRITVIGADARLTAGRFGHLYAGVAHAAAVNAGTVSGVIEVLNARGGPELISEYLGPDSGGDGSLLTFGGQYDLSVSRLVFGERFTGQSPDVLLSAFGIGTMVDSKDEAADGTSKLKVGGEATYSMVSWFGVSGRFDYVSPDSKNSERAFTIVSPRLLFHTGWQSRDQFVLQYSKFSYGKDVTVKTGLPPVEDPTAIPDEHVLSLSGSFWW